ncbi:histidine kinase [Inhella sp. 4Y17]|uniref:histidine kinase n=2 Tax=Inhella gelatinilytica TaxID=2795030 RepID=A0A931IVK8_9BURK|nr:histidine kinase [Inhella gelatinilytica]
MSWWRFAGYSIGLLIAVHLFTGIFLTWRFTETVSAQRAALPEMPEMPELPAPPQHPGTPDEEEVPEPPAPGASGSVGDVSIQIGKKGVFIGTKDGKGEAAQVDIHPGGVRIVAPREPGSAASAPPQVFEIKLPQSVSEELRKEVERDMNKAAQDAAREARNQVEQEYQKELRQWQRDYERALKEWKSQAREKATRTRVVHAGEALENLAALWVMLSLVIKATYKGRQEAEAKAAAAEETAEAEALRRQLAEARLNTMQAQVEPHFLFNTLASIDHLIEVDPKRASQMQKNLIALLRATMPTMREANGQGNGLRDLKREMAVVRPYLEILQVRMEERLQVDIDVPEGLLSAEFPPMIIQSLVENAIKHGLEPKPEGGSLAVRARIEHGKLVVEVADTGLGFGRAATSGTGVGLANTRERLQLLFGNKASLTVAENQPCGTIIRVAVPYKSNEPEQGA